MHLRISLRRTFLPVLLFIGQACVAAPMHYPPLLNYAGARSIEAGQRVADVIETTTPVVFVHRGTPGDSITILLEPRGFDGAIQWGEESAARFTPLGAADRKGKRGTERGTAVVPPSGELIILARTSPWVEPAEFGAYTLTLLSKQQSAPKTTVTRTTMPPARLRSASLLPDPGLGTLPRLSGRIYLAGERTAEIFTSEEGRRLEVAFSDASLGYTTDRLVVRMTEQPGLLEVLEVPLAYRQRSANFTARMAPDGALELHYVLALTNPVVVTYRADANGLSVRQVNHFDARYREGEAQVMSNEQYRPATRAELAAAADRIAQRREQRRLERIEQQAQREAMLRGVLNGIETVGTAVSEVAAERSAHAEARTRAIKDSIRRANEADARAAEAREAEARDGTVARTRTAGSAGNADAATTAAAIGAPTSAPGSSASAPALRPQPNSTTRSGNSSATRQAAATAEREEAARAAQSRAEWAQRRADVEAGRTSSASGTPEGQPLRFVLTVSMTNLPGDKFNPTCYSNIITRPGPPGWGGKGFLPSGSGEQAVRIVLSLKSQFIAACERNGNGRRVTSPGNVNWVSNQYHDGAQALATMGPKNREDVSVRLP